MSPGPGTVLIVAQRSKIIQNPNTHSRIQCDSPRCHLTTFFVERTEKSLLNAQQGEGDGKEDGSGTGESVGYGVERHPSVCGMYGTNDMYKGG